MEASFKNRCPVTIVVFDPQNDGRVTATITASAVLYFDIIRKCYLVHYKEHRIRVKFEAEKGYHARIRLTQENFRRLFRSTAIENKDLEHHG